MPATRRSPDTDLAPAQRRAEIISILAVGLVRLIGGSGAAVTAPAEARASISGTSRSGRPSDGASRTFAGSGPSMPADAPANSPSKKTLGIRRNRP